MNPKIAFRTEGNIKVGLGHLTECLSLAKRLQNQYAIPSLFIISHDTVEIQGLNGFNPYVEKLPSNTGEDDSKFTGRILEKYGLKLLIINLRSVALPYLAELKEKGITVICIDELGNKEISVDVVINGSIVADWHIYKPPNKPTDVYLGPDYMIMDAAFGAFHKKKKAIRARGTEVLVSMGGADPSGATLRVIKALEKLDRGIKKSIIIGPAFAHRQELEELLSGITRNTFEISHAVSNMAELMFEADIAISHGGNTLYELACTGTPNLALYEYDHEGIQAGVFEREGATICLGQGVKVPLARITSSVVGMLQDKALRKRMSQNGKRLVDGRGTDRICSIILDKI